MYFTHPQFKNFSLKPFFKKFSEADLKNKLNIFFPQRHIVFTDYGRSAFQIAVQELKLENSEILIPAYICDIFSPILKHYNIKPIYLDIDLKTFNINASEIEQKITPQTKSILICHTYGLPVEMDKILEIAEKHNLKIIEDCAHMFPSTIYGDYTFFSLPKFLPSVNGGILISKKPINYSLSDYKFTLGNIIKFARLFPILAKISELFRTQSKGNQGEIKGESRGNPRKASKLSLKIFNWYLDNFEEQISKRTELAKYFQEKLRKIGFEVQKSENNTFIYISALVPESLNRDELFKKLRKKGIFCSRIWQKPIISDKQRFPNTYESSKRIINFPLQNWFSQKDVDEIINDILSALNSIS
jgi:dTDP-4-amino-4,6-dideoxygalactose transaminase